MKLRNWLVAALIGFAPLAAHAQSGNQAALDAANAELASAQEDLAAAQTEEGRASVNFGQLSASRVGAHEANWRAQEQVRRQIDDLEGHSPRNDGAIAAAKAQLQGLIAADAAADKALSDAQWALTSAQSAAEQARARIARAQAQIDAAKKGSTTTTTSTTPSNPEGHQHANVAPADDDELLARALAYSMIMEAIDETDDDALTQAFLNGLEDNFSLGANASAPTTHSTAPAVLGAAGTAAAVGAITRGVPSSVSPAVVPPVTGFRGKSNWRSNSGHSGSSGSGGSGFKKSASSGSSSGGPSGKGKHRLQGSSSQGNISGMGKSYVNRFSGGSGGGWGGKRRRH